MREVGDMNQGDPDKATRMLHRMGRFAHVFGILTLVFAAIGLVVFLATGPTGEGLARVIVAFGTGATWLLIGYGLRRVTY